VATCDEYCGNHETNLLSPRFFRTDQIWFTQKDQHGATELFCLAEFRLENHQKINQPYFQGKYGAIPLVDEFDEDIF
jgi:AAA15 family ATPase/GTPase